MSERRKPQERVGSVVPEDADLATWLHKLWHRNEVPSRLEVWQLEGQNRGEMIHHEDFKPSEKLDIERCTVICNEIYAAAQNDVDSVTRPRKRSFQIAVIDMNRKATPLTRTLGPVFPKRGSIVKSGEEDDENEHLDGKNLNLSYIKEAFEQVKWDKARYDKVMGDLLVLQSQIIVNQQQQMDLVFKERMNFFSQLQEAQDRSEDRRTHRSWNEFKIALAKDGMRTVRNLLPAMFAPEEQQQLPPNTNGGTNGNAVKTFGPSAERTLIDNFLHDCEDTGVDLPLFGECKVENGVIKLADESKPGIFTLSQFGLMLGVKDGKFSPDALIALMPDSGSPLAIKPEQILETQKLLSEGTGTGLMELIGLCKRRQAAQAIAAAQKSETATEPANETKGPDNA